MSTTQTVLIVAAVAAGGVVLYTQLRPKPGYAGTPAPQYYQQAPAPPAPTSPPKSSPSAMERIAAGAQLGADLIKTGKSIFDLFG